LVGADGAAETDLAPAHERWLGGLGAAAEARLGVPLLTGYPMVKRPFYTHPDPSRRPTRTASTCSFAAGAGHWRAAAAPVQRLPGGLASQGERDLTPYNDISMLSAWDAAAWRLRDRLERFVSRLVGLANVREATLFPRDLHRLTPKVASSWG